MRQAVHLVLPGTLNKFNLKVHMPHLSFNSDSLDVSRFDYKDEDVRALRQSVSVQMHVMVDAATHPSGCGFGITLFDLQEEGVEMKLFAALRIITCLIINYQSLMLNYLENRYRRLFLLLKYFSVESMLK